ncbi:hypothetical protein CRYUN_Cryun04dG0122100 [Craigia yunnanensis]
MIIRYAEGAVIGIHRSSSLGTVDSFMVEAKAAAQALEFAYNMGFKEVELKGDAHCVIKELQSTEVDLSPIDTLMEETRSSATSFNNFTAMHIGRERNAVAHNLAKYGVGLNEKTSMGRGES